MSIDHHKGKKHLSVVVVGHVDSGKSTTSARLLFELGALSGGDLQRLSNVAKELGKESFIFAFLMDIHKDERVRGLSVTCRTRDFFTNSYHYTIIDAPGHRDFVKHMISGASQADVGILMVPAAKGFYETSIAKGNHKIGELQGQSRQHARLCHLIGVEQLIVCVNKMDDEYVDYSENRFKEIKVEVSKMLTKIGFKIKKIPFIPISGWVGDNVAHTSVNMKWYKGWSIKIKKDKISGFTLTDALEKAVQIPKRKTGKPFRMPIGDMWKINGVGDVLAGRVEQGQLVPDTNVIFYPSGIKGKAFSIEMHHKTVKNASAGDIIGVNVKGLKKESMPRIGDVMCSLDEQDLKPPKAVLEFCALVFVQDHPGQLKSAKKQYSSKNGYEYKGGFTPSIHVRTGKVPCKMIEIKWKMGKSTNNQKVESPPYIEAGDQAEVIFRPVKPFVVVPFDECKPLGRIAAMDHKYLVMLGKVVSVVHKH